MANIDRLCAKATLIEKAMKSFDTKGAQYILYNKQDKNISMFEVTTPYAYITHRDVITNPENQVTTENIKAPNIVYYKLDVFDEGNDAGNDGVCVKAVGNNDVGDNGPNETGKYVVIKEGNNTPMIVTIAQNGGDMINEAEEEEEKKTVKPDEGNRYYKIQGEAGKVTADAAVEIGEGGDGEQLDVNNEEQVAAAAAKKAEEDAAAQAGQGGDGASGQGGARKKKRRNPTKKGRKSGKKGRKSGKKSRKARRSRRSKK